MVRDVSLVMKRNHKYLVDNLKNVKSLLEELFTKRVISSEHLQYFNKNDEGKKTNRKLSLRLSMMTEADFKLFLQALRDTDQEDIALRLAPEEVFDDFDQPDNSQADFKIIDYDVSKVKIRKLDKAELDNRVRNPRNYPMSLQLRSKNRLGKVLIINNLKFDFIAKRDGSEKDVELLKAVFERLHLTVQTADDLTAVELKELLRKECHYFNKFNGFPAESQKENQQEMSQMSSFDMEKNECEGSSKDRNKIIENNCEENKGEMIRKKGDETATKYGQQNDLKNDDKTENEAREEDYKGACVFILLVMSHGGKGHVYGVDGSQDRNNVSIDEIMDIFNGQNCPGLNGKPKLVFIQACQEDEVKMGTDTSHWRNVQRPPKHKTTHKMADSFLMLSTVQGEKSLRHIMKGTYFIHIVCHTIATKCHHWNLMDMMTEIHAQHRSVIIKRTNGLILQQQPESKTKLSYNFFFLP